MLNIAQTYPNVLNSFINTLTNKVTKSLIYSKIFTNPLKELKKGALEYGDFICFIDEQHEDKYFFGGSVLTEKFKQIELSFTEDEIKELLAMGIEIVCTEKKSKNNRKYISVEFK